MLGCKRKSVNIKRKTLISFKKLMYFIPPRVSKERTLFVEGDKEAVSWDKRGRGRGEGNRRRGQTQGVRRAGYGKRNIPIHKFIYQI